MLKHQIAELRKKRAKLVQEARSLVARRAEGEDDTLTAEDQAQFDRIMEEVDALKARIDRLEQLAEAEAEASEEFLEDLHEAGESGEGGDPVGSVEEDEPRGRRSRRGGRPRIATRGQRGKARRMSPEYRQAFWRALRGEASPEDIRTLHAEARALNITTPAKGGYVVPDEFERTLVQKLEDENVMRRLGTVLTTVSGEREIPVESDIGTAVWLDEAGSYTESDVTFDQAQLGAHKLGRIIKASEELMHDSFFDIEEYVSDVYARSFGRTEEAAMVNGDGSKKPTGVVQGSQKGADAAKDALTEDNIIDLYHGLRRPYRTRATWLMADGTTKLVRKLKDENGQYLWQPGIQVGEPDVLLGRPVEVSDYMPAVGAGTKSILFGDFSHYWIADRVGRIMQRLDELYAANGQVGFRAYQRIDGKLILPEAVVHLLHAAA